MLQAPSSWFGDVSGKSSCVLLCRINTEGVIHQVKCLFNGHIELILGFNTFLPKVRMPAYCLLAETSAEAPFFSLARPHVGCIFAGLRDYHARPGTRGGQGELSFAFHRMCAACIKRIDDSLCLSYRRSSRQRITVPVVAAQAACGVRPGYQLCEQNQGEQVKSVYCMPWHSGLQMS